MFDRFFSQSITVLGEVSKLDVTDANRPSFMLKTRLAGTIQVHLSETTNFQPLMNLDRVNRDRYPKLELEEPEVIKQIRQLKEEAEKQGFSVGIDAKKTPAARARQYLLEGDAEFDLRLVPSLDAKSALPMEGKSLIIVAEVEDKLHFRIFDGNGKVVEDTDQERLKTQDQQIQELRQQLENLWPSHEVAESDKNRLMTAVKSIVGYTGSFVSVQGIYQRHEGRERFEARTVFLLQQAPIERSSATPMGKEMKTVDFERRFYFENTYWWINQIQRLADKWLDDLFDELRDYKIADFAKLYRTDLNIVGLPTDDNVQEMATLSRLIYGLSSAYLLTGIDRYRMAADAGVGYQREAFRGSSADGRFCFWSSAKRRMKYGSQYDMTSQNPDDKDTIPLYEQIYALAGLAQYYRITADREVLEDIRRTVTMIRQFFRDDPESGGYFSHLDYVTFQPTHRSLKDNESRKNWNSIGDHIPAYLINVILALDPLPVGREDLQEFLEICQNLLRETTDLICKHFPEKDSRYVQERFKADWSPDREWGWQKNRAIVGHNLKIAWNLTRAANYFETIGDENRASSCMELASRLGDDMDKFGLDPLRGGCFDAVERQPNNGMPIEFAWGNTKDFWQQEQGILAYLILHGHEENGSASGRYLDLAREMMAFWNLFFLDRENQGIFFRVTENGLPVVLDGYGNKAGHSIAGYHAFELNFLAHIYLRSYLKRPKVTHQKFSLYYRPAANSQAHSINVLPDFFRPGTMTLSAVTVNGRRTEYEGRTKFQIELKPEDLGTGVVAEFQPMAKSQPATKTENA